MGKQSFQTFRMLVGKLTLFRFAACLLLTVVFITAMSSCKSGMKSALSENVRIDTLYLTEATSLADSIPGLVTGVSIINESVVLSLRKAEYAFKLKLYKFIAINCFSL